METPLFNHSSVMNFNDKVDYSAEGIVSKRVIQKEKGNLRIGFDVISENYMDMVDDGVIDPAKVTRGALENAASIAAMILTTEALITDLPEKEKPAPPQMPEY